jgi:hypothetical protein
MNNFPRWLLTLGGCAVFTASCSDGPADPKSASAAAAAGSTMSGAGVVGISGAGGATSGGSAASGGRAGGGGVAAASGGGAAGASGGGAAGASGGGAAGNGIGGGAGGTSGGSGGAPSYSTDRAEFFGAPRCGQGLALCDDFESRTVGGTPDPAIWSLRTTPNVTVAVDATRAARGTKSMRFTTPNVPSEAYMRETVSFARTKNAFYGRLFYFQPASGPQNFAHWNVIEATGPQTIAGIDMQAFYRYGGVSLGGIFNRYLFQFEHRPREPNYEEIGQEPPDNAIEPFDEWVCLEWFFDGDATEGRLWHDGVEVPALHATSPFHAQKPQPHDVSYKMPVFDGLNLGWAHYQSPEKGFEVWIDEVAVDKQRIGCSR